MAAQSIGGNCLCWRINGSLTNGQHPEAGEGATPFYHCSQLLPTEIRELARTIETWANENEHWLLPINLQHEEESTYGGVVVEVGPTPTENFARHLVQVKRFDELLDHVFPSEEHGTSDFGITTNLFEQAVEFEERIVATRVYRPQKRYFVLDYNGNKQIFRVENELTGQQADTIAAAVGEIAHEERVGFLVVSESDQFDRPELWRGCVCQEAIWNEPPYPEGARIVGTTVLDAACTFVTTSPLGHQLNELIDTLMAPMGVPFSPVPRQKDMRDECARETLRASADDRKRAPTWDNDALRLDSDILLRLAPRAKNLRMMLAAFEEEEWPSRIDDPLPGGNNDPGQRLRDAVKGLNARQNAIVFSSDGTGQGVCWKLRISSVEEETHNPPPARP